MRKTLKDVAQKAGVSVAVASRVLGNYGYVSEENKEKVLKAAKQIGYYSDILARSLKTKKTYSIGVIISDVTTFFFTSVVRGIEDVANQSGYHVTLCNSDEDPQKEREYLEELYKRRVDGIIISPTNKNIAYIKKIMRSGIPVVLVDRKIDEIDTTQILVDNEWASYEAVKHLINLGYRRIGAINGVKEIRTSEERFAGYKKALRESDIKIDPQLIKYGNFRMENGKEAMVELLKMKKPPDAVFVANETMTTGALLALKENEVKIPQEMAIIGFDDPVWAPLVDPPLTTVRQPSYSIGTIASQVLLQKMDTRGRKTKHEEIILKPKLIIRESCGEKIKIKNK